MRQPAWGRAIRQTKPVFALTPAAVILRSGRSTAVKIDLSRAKRCESFNEEPERCQWVLGLSDAE